MLSFELKKMWKQKFFLGLFLFTALFSIFVNKRARSLPTLMEYPQGQLNYSPYRAVHRQVIASVSHDIEDMKGESDLFRRPEVFREFQSLNKYWQMYLAQAEELEFGNSDYPEGLPEYEHRYAKFLIELNAFIEKHEISLRKPERRQLEWLLFETSYAEEHGVYRTTMSYNSRISNAMRRILFQNSFFFGIPVFVFLMSMFSGILSREEVSGNANFLKTQPLSRRKVIFAKMGAMEISMFVYLCFLALVCLVYFRFEKLPFDGGSEIYRIFDSDARIDYFTGWGLLLRVLIGYFAMGTFFCGWLLWVDSWTGNPARTMSITVFGSLLLMLVTKYFPLFQHYWNPMYATDYLRALIGKLSLFGAKSLGMNYTIYYAKGMIPFLFFTVFGLLFVFLATLEKKPVRGEVREKNIPKSFSHGYFERKKITTEQGFYFYMVAGLLILFLFMAELRMIDLPDVDVKAANEKELAEIQEERQKLNFYRTEEGQREVYRRFFGRETEKSFPTWHAEERQAYEEFLSKSEREISAKEKNFNDRNETNEVMERKDGRAYYSILLKEAEEDYRKYGADISLFYKSGTLSQVTYDERLAVMRSAAEQDVLPTSGGLRFNSAREEYISREHRIIAENERMPHSHSSVFILYRLFRYRYLDILFLVFLNLAVFGGYLFDKERGRQIELLYTEPVSRVRYHRIKIRIALGLSIALLGGLYLILFLSGAILEGVGAWNFPIVYYTAESFVLIPLWRYLLRILLLLSAQSFFLFTLSLFFSIFMEEKKRVMGATLGVIVLGTWISSVFPQRILRLLSPFHYLQASTVANGSVKIFRNLPQESFWGSVLILVVWGVVLCVAGEHVIKKRECV